MVALRAAVFVLLAGTACASEVTMEGLTVSHRNELTFAEGSETFLFEIPEGQVVLFLDRVDEACPTRPECPDTLSVVSLPTGMRAEPESVTTPEGATLTIEILPYEGF